MKPTKEQNKDFGLVATLGAIVASLITREWLWVYVASGLGCITAVVPVLLSPLSWCWFGLARVLERAVTSVLLTAVFYVLVTPVGLLRRVTSKKDVGMTSTLRDADHLYVPEDFDRQFVGFKQSDK